MRNMDSESAWATQWDPVSKKKGGAKVKIPVRFNNWEIAYLDTSSKPSYKACLNLNTWSLLLPVIAPPRA